MNNFLCKWFVLFPAHYIRGEKILKHLKSVDSVDKLNQDELCSYQEEKLLKVVQIACQQGIYESKFNNIHISLKNIISFFPTLPIVTKRNIRLLHKKLGTPDNTMDLRSTSGSTGEPLKFYKSKLTTSMMDAVQYSAFKMHGIGIGERQARFWGLPANDKARRLAHLKDLIKNRKRFSAFTLDDCSKQNFFEEMEKFRPTYFYGYPSLMNEFAKYMKREGLSFSFPLKAIIGTGEYAFQNQIEEIEQAFKAKYVNEYGCTEVGLIAFDCKHGQLHVMSQNIFLEVIKNGKPVHDEEGEICITELTSDYLPFIRYKIGDRGILNSKKCICGSHYPSIKIMAGRIDDYIITPSGKRIYDAILAYTLTDGVMRFKAFQKTIDELQILILPDGKINRPLFDQYKSNLNKAIGDDIKITFKYVNEIPKDPSGKQRYFISELSEC